MSDLKLNLGCMSPPICEQLDNQHLKYCTESVKCFQEKQIILCGLKFMDLFQPNMIYKAYDQLFKQIVKHINECNCNTPVKTAILL